MYCKLCGQEVPEENAYCAKCGAAVREEVNACSKCGNVLAEDENFCSKCGATATGEHNRFCRYCGKQIKAGERYCVHCGSAVTSTGFLETIKKTTNKAGEFVQEGLKKIPGLSARMADVRERSLLIKYFILAGLLLILTILWFTRNIVFDIPMLGMLGGESGFSFSLIDLFAKEELQYLWKALEIEVLAKMLGYIAFFGGLYYLLAALACTAVSILKPEMREARYVRLSQRGALYGNLSCFVLILLLFKLFAAAINDEAGVEAAVVHMNFGGWLLMIMSITAIVVHIMIKKQLKEQSIHMEASKQEETKNDYVR